MIKKREEDASGTPNGHKIPHLDHFPLKKEKGINI
jgi:hypothetical protein